MIHIYDKLESLCRACRECSRDRGPPARPPPARGGGAGWGGNKKSTRSSKTRNSLGHERPLQIFDRPHTLRGPPDGSWEGSGSIWARTGWFEGGKLPIYTPQLTPTTPNIPQYEPNRRSLCGPLLEAEFDVLRSIYGSIYGSVYIVVYMVHYIYDSLYI